MLVFEDESGFYLLPGLVRPYAPEGQTPVIHETQTRDHLSVLGGRTPKGKVSTLVRQEPRNGLHGIEFLTHLQKVAAERRLVIWDGSPIHRRVAVKEFVTQTKGKVWLQRLPGYAPDLNPWDEGGWHLLKNVEMRTCRVVILKSCTSNSTSRWAAFARSPIWSVPSSHRPDCPLPKVKRLARRSVREAERPAQGLSARVALRGCRPVRLPRWPWGRRDPATE